ncbi:MAG: ABC transporter ATP-binding protein [Oscillospiraceae bacterium]|nr:ABC transporter ATP-binding protein [Oscillospiraceae bacterium]
MGIQLQCKDTALGYDGRVVLQGLNFVVSEGDYLCILGENGSGKSTLMKTLLGLHTPSRGEIQFCGDTSQKEIGYLPQQTIVQRDFPASVQEIVLSGCLSRCGFRPFYTKQEKQLAGEIMQKLGIMDLNKRCYRELSGGQQQRVLLARALCSARKMLLLDEPVTGLDARASHEMYELIADLNQNDSVTIIMISHDIQASVNYASHILHIGGRQLFYGTKREYLQSKVGQAFLEMGGVMHD